jgi:cob(I)alamin adenosyltransferase
MAPRIYTRTGDRGETGLFGGGRVAKSHPRVEAYGAVDELNAVLGWAAAMAAATPVRERLPLVQHDLFAVGAHLAAPAAAGRAAAKLPELPAARIAVLEQWIDEAEAGLPELCTFILPGGSPAGAALHVARTVCRRAERRVVELAGADDVDDSIIIYLNRLSDLLFVLARLENRQAGAVERPWQPGAGG